ncbi:MAG: hypothetical protein WKF30_19400 [Pyrinomonadaceae bacterium]
MGRTETARRTPDLKAQTTDGRRCDRAGADGQNPNPSGESGGPRGSSETPVEGTTTGGENKVPETSSNP